MNIATLSTPQTTEPASLRVCVCGGPRVGKTTIANRIGGEHGVRFFSTDDLIGIFEWSELSEKVAERMGEPGPWVWEGCRVVHALRKALAARPEKPCDYVLWLEVPKVEQTRDQASFAKGILKVWNEVLPELRRRGVKVFTETQGELT